MKNGAYPPKKVTQFISAPYLVCFLLTDCKYIDYILLQYIYYKEGIMCASLSLCKVGLTCVT